MPKPERIPVSKSYFRTVRVWADKIRDQELILKLYVLSASPDELMHRTAGRPSNWQESFTAQGWERYRKDPDTLDFARRLSLPETVVDTTALTPFMVATEILKSL